MAVQDQVEQYFVEEIDYKEIRKLEVVGKGSFGVVWKGQWRDKIVAVKHIDTEAERKAFAVEVRQLSRVSHPNIVKLYGASTKETVCLVMEYAEGGSLYNVLHSNRQPRYTASHAISWCLQCARGVAYLHEMKPKALIHRDLKPPNLLLIKGGKVLKICDFGTACDKQTYMTNNKGSAAWMAPEVFEGRNYTEKCDVFSWGIILWEILTRQKPFDDIGGPAFRIMWAVHSGRRPPPIKGCPPPISDIMKKCWDRNPCNRPSMQEVVRIVSHLSQFFPGADEPVLYEQSSSDSDKSIPSRCVDLEKEEDDPFTRSFPEDSTSTEASNVNGTVPPSRLQAASKPLGSLQVDVGEGHLQFAEDGEDLLQRANPGTYSFDETFVPTTNTYLNPISRLHSAPYGLPPAGPSASAFSSFGVGNKTGESSQTKRRSADFNDAYLEPGHFSPSSSTGGRTLGHRRAASYGAPPETPVLGAEGLSALGSRSLYDVRPSYEALCPNYNSLSPSTSDNETSHNLIENAYLMLDPQLHPISPSATCVESMQVFEQHKAMALEYLKVQTELAHLMQYKNRLSEQLGEAEGLHQLDARDAQSLEEEMRQLQSENESLVQLHRNLKRQLEIIKSAQQKRQRVPSATDEEWVVVPNS